MDEQARTLWCGNLSEKVNEELLYELFLQVAPVERVHIPTDKNGHKSSYGFVTLKHQVSVGYAVQLLDGTSLFDRRITIKPRNQGQNQQPFSGNVMLMRNPLENPYGHNLPQHHENSYKDRPHKPYHRHNNQHYHNQGGNRQNWNNNYRNRRRY